jgi:hypothetical protein
MTTYVEKENYKQGNKIEVKRRPLQAVCLSTGQETLLVLFFIF